MSYEIASGIIIDPISVLPLKELQHFQRIHSIPIKRSYEFISSRILLAVQVAVVFEGFCISSR